jgi:hypothetical protein
MKVITIKLSTGFAQQLLALTIYATSGATGLASILIQKKLNGQLVYVGDGIKVSKEGRKMPGVKRLQQESANVSKPEWIRGHYFSALGIQRLSSPHQ